MGESVEKQKSISEKDKADLEDVLYRNKQRQELENSRWSRAIIKDVEIFKSYVFRDVENESSGSKFEAIESFTSNDDPKEAFLQVKDQEEDFSLNDWRNKSTFRRDGSFEFNGREYEYETCHKPVATVGKSDDSGYEKKITLSKFNSSPISVYNQLSNMKGRSILVGRSKFGGILIRTDGLERKGQRVTLTERSKIAFGGAIASLAITSILSPILMSMMGPFMGLSTMSFIYGFGTLLSMVYGYKRTSGLYSARKKDWLSELPDSAVVQSQDEHGHLRNSFELEEAKVEGYENGDVVIKTDNDQWTFQGRDDNAPSSEVEELFDEYTIDMMEGGIEIAVSEAKYVVKKSANQCYISDSGDNLFVTKENYYNYT